MTRRPPIYTPTDPPFPTPSVVGSAAAGREHPPQFAEQAAGRRRMFQRMDDQCLIEQRVRKRKRQLIDFDRKVSASRRPRAGTLIGGTREYRSEEHTSELQSLMRISYAVFCLKKKTNKKYKCD